MCVQICYYYLRLTGAEHITVSLVALFRIASHSFLKGVSLPANSCIATRKIRRQKLFDLPNREFFVLTKSEERRNTDVFQVMRQSQTENYRLSGVMGSTPVSLRNYTEA